MARPIYACREPLFNFIIIVYIYIYYLFVRTTIGERRRVEGRMYKSGSGWKDDDDNDNNNSNDNDNKTVCVCVCVKGASKESRDAAVYLL